MHDDAIPPIRHAVTVGVPPERAFAAFTERMSEWWPPEYSWSEAELAQVTVEPRAGGRWMERDRAGTEAPDWGRVLAWEPPRRVALSWMISPRRAPETDPARASEVEVRFVPVGAAATRVELEHRALSRHGDGAEAYRAGLDSPEGWPRILARYAGAAA